MGDTLASTPIITKASSVDDLVDAVCAAVDLLGERGTLPPDELPGHVEVSRWIRDVWTDRPLRGKAILRMRKSLTKDATDGSRALAGILRWHNSGGDLTGLMMARFTAGDLFDRVDTTATVIRVVAGAGTSPAVAAWERTGLVR